MKYFFFVLLAVSVLEAADLPKDSGLEVISDFTGGLNTASPAHKIGKNFSPNMRNVFTHRNEGKIDKRNGFLTVGSTNSLRDGRFGFTFYRSDGSSEFLVSDSSMVLSTRDFQTYVLVSSALNPSATLQATQAGQKVYFTNGVDAVFTWDGTNKQTLDGTKGLPNVPRFKTISYFQNRIFGLNTSADRTSLDWSAVVSTAGTILTPDSLMAWPAANHKSIGAGDGQSGTALWVQRGQLQIGKERSIWTLFGDRDSNYIERRTEDQAGVASQDCVTLLDGVAYHKGSDGVYSYNCVRSERISDLISPDVDAMEDPTTQILQNSWETQSDFAKGEFRFGSTATPSGFVTVSTNPFIVSYNTHTVNELDILAPPQFVRFPNTGGTIDSNPITSTNVVPAGFVGFLGNLDGRIDLYTRCNCTGGTNFPVTTVLKNTRTGVSKTYGPTATDMATTFSRKQVFSGTKMDDVLFTAEDIITGSMTFSLTIGQGTGDSGNTLDVYLASTTGYNSISLNHATTVQYISDVSTLNTVTAWGSFDSVNNTNGGTIDFFLRTSTSVVNITTQVWTSISPGVTVNAPIINNFVQFAATLAAVSQITPSEIDNVTIDHIEGSGSANRPISIDWNNEYWLSVSTDLTSSLRLQYVKSWISNPTPNAWNVLSQMNIGSLFKDGSSVLYGGASSAPFFYRLDYGTNDDGRAIDAFYDTPELFLKGGIFGGIDGNWTQKTLNEYWLDLDAETGNTFRLGTSIDGRAFTEETISLDGSTRILKVLYTPNKFGKYFQWRFRNSQIDKGLGLNSFGVVYQPTKNR